jgi:hypothetical protein
MTWCCRWLFERQEAKGGGWKNLKNERWTLDVRCSSFETSPDSINPIFEHLQNNLALMGQEAGISCSFRRSVCGRNKNYSEMKP